MRRPLSKARAKPFVTSICRLEADRTLPAADACPLAQQASTCLFGEAALGSVSVDTQRHWHRSPPLKLD